MCWLSHKMCWPSYGDQMLIIIIKSRVDARTSILLKFGYLMDGIQLINPNKFFDWIKNFLLVCPRV